LNIFILFYVIEIIWSAIISSNKVFNKIVIFKFFFENKQGCFNYLIKLM